MDTAEKKYHSVSPEETEKFAALLAAEAKAGDVYLLDGEMGAGKTVFAKGFARGLGVEDEITSPTYAYMNEYAGKRLTLYHYDCYRVESAERAEGIGLGEYFYMGGVCLVEWAQNIAPLLPEDCKRIRIVKVSENEREIWTE